MNETRGNTRTKPLNFDNPITIEDYRQILRYYYGLEENKSGGIKGGEMNSLKDTEKTNDNKWLYYPILDNINFCKPPKIIYYEIRVWINHNIISMNVYTTLKNALKDYKKRKLDELEDKNKCFVEIVKIDNLNPRYK